MRKILICCLLSLFVYSPGFAQVTKNKNTSAKPGITYLKTKSSLLYKIFPSATKTPLIKSGQIVKFHYTVKYNDSVLFDSHGRLPAYIQVKALAKPSYDLEEIIPKMKKGDSAVTIQIADTLLKQQKQLPFTTKKGDKIISSFRIINVFAADSIARADYNMENEKDMPRQLKEQEEQMAKEEKSKEEQRLKDEMELEKSGEVAKELKEMEEWLASKKITATKTGKGTFVSIQQEGTGPAAEIGKYVNVKYTGKVLATDSVFQSASYAFKLGTESIIRGWNEGLQLFKQGGKGTLYIPGFLAWKENPGPAGVPYAPVIFEVEILEVSDKPIPQK